MPQRLSLSSRAQEWWPLKTRCPRARALKPPVSSPSTNQTAKGLGCSLRPHALQPPRLLCPWDSPGQNARVRGHSLPQGIFPTRGSNPGLLHCRQTLYRLSHRGSPCSLQPEKTPHSKENPAPPKIKSISKWNERGWQILRKQTSVQVKYGMSVGLTGPWGPKCANSVLENLFWG